MLYDSTCLVSTVRLFRSFMLAMLFFAPTPAFLFAVRTFVLVYLFLVSGSLRHQVRKSRLQAILNVARSLQQLQLLLVCVVDGLQAFLDCLVDGLSSNLQFADGL